MRQHRRILRSWRQHQRQHQHYRSDCHSGPVLLRHVRLCRLLIPRSVLFQQIFRNELSVVQQHRRGVRWRLLLLLPRLQKLLCRPTMSHGQVILKMQYCCRVVVGDCFWNTHIVETITATRLTVWQSARLSFAIMAIWGSGSPYSWGWTGLRMTHWRRRWMVFPT